MVPNNVEKEYIRLLEIVFFLKKKYFAEYSLTWFHHQKLSLIVLRTVSLTVMIPRRARVFEVATHFHTWPRYSHLGPVHASADDAARQVGIEKSEFKPMPTATDVRKQSCQQLLHTDIPCSNLECPFRVTYA